VEVGFLQLILKGGFVYFILYMFLLVATVYKGIFTKHNSKIAFLISIYILTEIFIMFIENIPAFHFEYFVMFFLAGYAYRNATVVNVPVIKNEKLSNENFDNYSFLQPGPLY
jgi:membrane-associated HD superfamily phosphohydrolase